MRIINQHSLIYNIYHMAKLYPAPANLSYFWNYGSLALFCLIIQIMTGIFLAMNYAATVEYAFYSCEYIMREVNSGWLLRYSHANGASAFFFVVYLHIFRGLYYGSYVYPRDFVWISGVIIFLLMILTAFMGYVLPWGQMSFWAATVITNLASVIPLVGKIIVNWLWGGYSVDFPTLMRFFSLHYLFPFLILILVIIHLLLLHEDGSNNPLGLQTKDKLPFTPYFTIKDIYGVVLFLIIFIYFVTFEPNLLGHPDNYIEADAMVTPAHIVPEWYFLPFYAILRSVPNKLGGVVLMLSSILVLVGLPFFSIYITRNCTNRQFYQKIYWGFVGNYIFLGYIGSQNVEYPYYEVGQIATCCYFIYIIGIVPLFKYLDVKLIEKKNK